MKSRGQNKNSENLFVKNHLYCKRNNICSVLCRWSVEVMLTVDWEGGGGGGGSSLLTKLVSMVPVLSGTCCYTLHKVTCKITRPILCSSFASPVLKKKRFLSKRSSHYCPFHVPPFLIPRGHLKEYTILILKNFR